MVQVRRHHVRSSVVIDLLLLEAGMHLLRNVVQVGTIVCVGQRTVVDGRLRNMAAAHTHAVSVHSEVDQCGVILVESMASAVLLVVAFHLLALQLALYALAVRGVSDEREDRPDTLNQEHALRRLCVVKRGLQARLVRFHPNENRHPYLNAVVSEGITQQFLETIAVQKLLDQHFASVVLSHSDALLKRLSDRRTEWN